MMIDEPRIEIVFVGWGTPVQARGTIDGRPFYFRARHEHWSLAVARDPGVDPADIDHPGQGFYWEGVYDLNGPRERELHAGR